MSLKKAALAAAVCTALEFVPPRFATLLWYLNSMTTGERAGIQSLSQAAAMWAFLPSLGLAVFLTTLFLEQCGRARSPTRRRVARIGAALMGVQAVLQGALLVKTISGLGPASSTVTYELPWTLVRMTLSGVAASALWTALLSRFAAEDDPFQGAATRPLALILAADTAIAGLWATCGFAPTLRAVWAQERYMAWVSLLATALDSLVWVSLFVFLLSVWRCRTRAAGRRGGREWRAADVSSKRFKMCLTFHNFNRIIEL